MLPVVLTAAIVAGYAAALWWLLRRESLSTVLGVVVVAAVALCLRLAYTTDYPAGLAWDEAYVLSCSQRLLHSNQLFAEGCLWVPILLNALFQAQFIPFVGPGFWAIRGYPMATSVLAIPAAFATARRFGLGVVPSLAVSAFMAVLPWSIFYGRVSFGGELVFHEMLVLAALGSLIWGAGGWVDAAIGSFGMALLLYDYWCGRIMIVLVPVAAVLAPRGRRLLCLAIAIVAVLAWVPHMASNPPNLWGGNYSRRLQPMELLETLPARFAQTATAFVKPTAGVGALSPFTMTMHPLLILVLAALGVFGARGLRGAFLLVGFLVGTAPALLNVELSVNTHRMMMAFPFIAIAAGSALDRLQNERLRLVVTAAAVLVVSFQSVHLYFSKEFWPPNIYDGTALDADRTALMAALPPPPRPRLVAIRQLETFVELAALADPNYELLNVENYMPPEHGAVFYAFDRYGGPQLRVFYENLFGPQHVQAFGTAFLVSLENNDWSWVRQHGWALTAECGSDVYRAQVPTLFQPYFTFSRFPCREPSRHIWRGHWNGPEQLLRLYFTGTAEVRTPERQLLHETGDHVTASFVVPRDTDLTVTLAVPTNGGINVSLVESAPAGDRVPLWESVSPLW